MNSAAASSRTNDAPGADGGRLAGMSAQAAALMRQAGECLERSDFARAASFVAGAGALEPAHP